MSMKSIMVRFLLRRSGMWNKPLEEIRKSLQGRKVKLPEGVKLTEEVMEGVVCKTFSCSNAARDKAILYFHGGGFCLGIYETNSEFVARIAKRTGMNLYLPDYRLAPENPYPAALEDAVKFYQGMMKRGYDPENMVMMGDSSGCALAVSALLMCKSKGIPMPKALAFITPVFDLQGKGESYITRARKDPFQTKDPLGLTKNYIGTNNAAAPFLSPMNGDLSGLPPILLHAADYDVFLSDSERFTQKITAVKGVVELKVWRKMWHIFHMQAPIVPEAEKAFEEFCSWVQKIIQDNKIRVS